jgi:CHASE2 domain-containing sensor protein
MQHRGLRRWLVVVVTIVGLAGSIVLAVTGHWVSDPAASASLAAGTAATGAAWAQSWRQKKP